MKELIITFSIIASYFLTGLILEVNFSNIDMFLLVPGVSLVLLAGVLVHFNKSKIVIYGWLAVSFIGVIFNYTESSHGFMNATFYWWGAPIAMGLSQIVFIGLFLVWALITRYIELNTK